MINDANFASSLAAWKSHRNLRTSLFNAPFVLDVDSRSCLEVLNELRRQRRIDFVGLGIVSDSEDEELVPDISSYMAQISNHAHIPGTSRLAAGANAIDSPAQNLLDPLPENEAGSISRI